MHINEKNILASYLDLLHVKHTKHFTNKYFEEHPNRYNLFGLSSMLATYGIESNALRVEKEADTLLEIGAPFIAYIENDFALVYQINPDKIKYYWRKKKIILPMEEFLLIWSGVILLAETDQNSIEPDYLSHRQTERIERGKNIIMVLTIFCILGIASLPHSILAQTGFIFSLLINITGEYVCYLLLLKQLHIYSDSANHICSLFSKKGDCNHVLETNAAKFMGIFSWSEIGLGYFTTNIFILLLLPCLYPYLAIINLLVLPYTVWSIWYQCKVVKQWCILCMIVQVILWLLFFNNCLFNLFTPLSHFYQDMFLTVCLYIIPVFLLNRIVPLFVHKSKLTTITQQLNSLKSDDEIFNILQKRQPYYPIDRNLGILWGNTEAKNIITVITNPHCIPCATLHKQLEKLLKDTDNKYCIQYILVSFNIELEQSSRLLIAMYQKLNKQDFLIFLNSWYTIGKYKPREFYLKYPFNDKEEKLQKEQLAQKEWLNKLPIRKTPTILFNGNMLTDKYNIEDLAFLSLK